MALIVNLNDTCKWTLFKALLMINLLQAVSLTEFTHDRKRIGPVNLVRAEHSCLQKFSVSENTIIRTQDSRIQGAKFLNVSDVDSRESCLSLCCSTRFCDVAVFQEKTPFPCYLFDCGPPEEFVCKFSTHSYYTSAVLTINRHQLDLGLWSSQHKHEAELSDLRSAPEMLEISEPIPQPEVLPSSFRTTQNDAIKITAKSTTSTTIAPPVTTSSSHSAPKTQPGRRCSRFQFECHSGECIAIYNVCDGIAQCQDNSDESHDLSCPQDILSDEGSSDLEQVQTPNGISNQESSWSGQPSNRRKYDKDRAVYNHRDRPNVGPEYNYESRYAGGASPDYHREEGVGYGGKGKGPGFFDYNQRMSSPNGRYSTGKQRDINGDGSSMYQHEYPDYGLLHPLRDRLQQQTPPLMHQQANLQLKNLPSEHKLPQQYQQPIGKNQNPIWQNPNSQMFYPMDQKQQKPYLPRDQMGSIGPVYDGRESTRQQQNAYRQQNDMRQYVNVEESPQSSKDSALQLQQPLTPETHNSGKEMKEIIPSTNSKQVPVQQEKVVEKPTNDKTSESKTVIPSTPVQSSNKSSEKVSKIKNNSSKSSLSSSLVSKVSQSSISRLEVDIKELESEAETQMSQISGAVLALSLGVCITGILIVLVGCRIRGVKRRAHRHRGMKSPLEHDADYLVNGMYL